MSEADRRALVWAAFAFSAALAAAIGVLAVFGMKSGIPLALKTTARLAFLFFFSAYAGGALTALFGDVFLPVKKRGRELGLAFAAAILVHLSVVACLCVLGPVPSKRTFAIFGAAAVSALLLVCLSFPWARRRLPDNLWPPLRLIATNYIAFAFAYDFVQFSPSADVLEDIAYLPFAALAILGPALRLAAWVKARPAPLASARTRSHSSSP